MMKMVLKIHEAVEINNLLTFFVRWAQLFAMFLTDLYISNKRRSNDVMNVGSIFIGQSKNWPIKNFDILLFQTFNVDIFYSVFCFGAKCKQKT